MAVYVYYMHIFLYFILLLKKSPPYNSIVRINVEIFLFYYKKEVEYTHLYNIIPTSRTAAPTTQAKGLPPNVLM